jgi:two-component system, cell cycle response regulator DivK
MTGYSALVIDDNPLNNDVLLTLLEQHGVKTVAIESPQAVEETIDAVGVPSVIFLDLEFPNYDGFDIFAVLRDNPLLNNTPIVAYSVHISEIDRARQAGFDGFLGKPLNAQQFQRNLEQILNGDTIWEV